MIQVLANIMMAAAGAALLTAVAVDHPLVTREDITRWVDRPKPARLLRGRGPRRRAAVWLLVASAVLGVPTSLINATGDNTWWMGMLGALLPVEGLILLDISQHSRLENTTTTQGAHQ